MNTEDDKLLTQQDKLDTLVVIGDFLDYLQDRYELNDFCPADRILSKNGDTIFAKVKDRDGRYIILHRWKLDKFKDSKLY